MTNATCPYFKRNCHDETIKYDDNLCLGEGNFRNCGMYQRLVKIQEQVEQRTPERRGNILSILTEHTSR